MPFTTSKFSAQFQQLILDRVQTVLENDVNTALAAIDGTLAAVVDFNTPTPLLLNFPGLYLEPDTSAIRQSDDDSYLMELHTLLITLSIVGPDPDTLKVRIVKYVRAIDQVLRSMSVSDLQGAVSSSIRRAAWEVTEHRYGLLRANENTIYRRDAQLVFTAELLER